MLEVLDPEQNRAFTDHYLGVPFDLSRVTFLATANDPEDDTRPLRDRMEMIDVPGYTPRRSTLAMTHVVPRVLDEHGLLRPKPRLTIPREGVEVVVRSYTREAGVRGLQRCLASLCRAAAVHAAQASDHKAVEGGGGGRGGGGGVVLASPPKGPDSGGPRGIRGDMHPAAAALSRIGPDGVPVVTRELIEKVLGPRGTTARAMTFAPAGSSRASSPSLLDGGRGHHVHRSRGHARRGFAAADGSARGRDQGERAHRDVLGAVHAAALGLTGDSMPFPGRRRRRGAVGDRAAPAGGDGAVVTSRHVRRRRVGRGAGRALARPRPSRRRRVPGWSRFTSRSQRPHPPPPGRDTQGRSQRGGHHVLRPRVVVQREARARGHRDDRQFLCAGWCSPSGA